jgi:hypothetical protein
MTAHTCRARQYNDQMICGPCGLSWDINDPLPPKCPKHRGRLPLVDALPPLTDRLPYDIAEAAYTAYRAHTGGVPGIMAAYRVILDWRADR